MRLQLDRYQLRKAAGRYWLLNMAPRDGHYQRPWELNAAGAEIWRLLEAGQSPEETAGVLAERYKVPMSQVREDINAFLNQLSE